MSRPNLRQGLGFEVIQVSLKERFVAALGGGVAIYLLWQLCTACLHGPQAIALVASMGASTVLLFAVPHGPLSQPWPVLANAAMLVGLAMAINFAFPWQRYPAILSRPAVRAAPRAGEPPSHEAVLAAVRDLDSFVDISEEDLIRLAKRLAPPKA
jgi:CBS-domain-containing membrane protein